MEQADKNGRWPDVMASLNLQNDDLRNYLPYYGPLVRLDLRIVQPLYTFGKLDAALKLDHGGEGGAEELEGFGDFEVEAVDYLTKPVRLERLQGALQKVERLTQAGRALEPDLAQEHLLIQDRGRTERVPLAEVLYFKAELKYVTVRTATRSYILDGSLNELEAQHARLFIRVHRNALVARRAMRALEKHMDPEEGEGWAVRLTGLDDELLAVSRRQLPAVREALTG